MNLRKNLDTTKPFTCITQVDSIFPTKMQKAKVRKIEQKKLPKGIIIYVKKLGDKRHHENGDTK